MSKRVSIGDIETRKLKRKFEEKPPTLAYKEKNSSDQQLQSLKPVDPSKNQVQEDESLICKFCKKKFRNSQGLGGHQNAHKRERLLLNIEKELKMNAYGFGPYNVPLYNPYALSSISNPPLQGIPFYHGAHIMHPMAHQIPNNQGFSLLPQNLGLTSSWGGGVATSQWRLNPEALWQQIHSLAESASENRVSGSSSCVGAGFGGASENPSVSTKDWSSEDLDLALKL